MQKPYQDGVTPTLRIIRVPVTQAILEHLLWESLDAWFDLRGDQFPFPDHYSSGHNGFLQLAEALYFEFQAAWREQHEAIDAERADAALRRSGRPDPPQHTERPRRAPEGYWVYRLWDDHDRLIYVGSTRRITQRLARHRVAMDGLWTRATYEEFATPEAMLAAERVAIATELPAMNIADV